METSIELITNLDRAQKEWGYAMLVVGFPEMTRVVPSDFANRLQILETLLQQGGIPAGVVTMFDSADGTEHFFYGVFENDITAGWGDRYMEAFVNRMASPQGEGEVFTESIGIDQFRIRQ